MKIGALFSGQGAQYVGMGRDLYENFPAAKDVFDRAGDDIKHWCFDGDEDALKQTAITQPAVYTVSMAAWVSFLDELAKETQARVEIAGMAGFSLGEYAAYTASGVVADIETGLEIVRKRGELMSEAGRRSDGSPRGAMAALMGSRESVLRSVEAARGRDVLEAVNFNAPGQTVVAGDKEAVDRLKTVGRDEGLKIIPLNVSTAFHTPIMNSASENFRRFLENYTFGSPKTPLCSNITGKNFLDGKPKDSTIDAWVRDRMAEQVRRPVLWQETIENMRSNGIRCFAEFGPGKTLTKLVKRIAPDACAFNAEDGESLMKTIGEIRDVAQ
ncbi:MAG: ACP S-malonyltransferase [Clostridiales Family XIII bacterium]|nr:ACP S-malonyltransferase [Clostridiales Family XIII bacterium]